MLRTWCPLETDLIREGITQIQPLDMSRHSSSTFPIFQNLDSNRSLSGRLLSAFNQPDSAFGTGRINYTEPNKLTAQCAMETSTFVPTAPRLPPSICIQIAHHLDLRDRASLYQTTHTFRDALFSDRTLWNRITVPKIQGSAGAKMWWSSRTLVSRAQPGSIHIRVGKLLDSRPQAMCMWETLDHLLQILTTASLEFDPVYPDPTEPRGVSQEAALWMLMCQEAPSLERLSLTAPVLSFDGSMILLPEEFLGANAGSLRYLPLQQVNIQTNVVYLALSRLREFNYIAGRFNAGELISSSHIQAVLDNIPQREYLGLASFGFVLDTLRPTVQHDHLHHVQVEYVWEDVNDLARFFQRIEKARQHRSPSHGTALYDLWPQGDLSVSLLNGRSHVQHDSPDPAYSFAVWDSVEWSLTGNTVTNIGVPSAHALRIVSLSMNEAQWDTAVHLPPLPRLSTLSIVLSTCYGRRHSRSESLWSAIVPPDGVP